LPTKPAPVEDDWSQTIVVGSLEQAMAGEPEGGGRKR
jgi:hypothetical protein